MIKLFKTQRINSNVILFVLLLLIQVSAVFAQYQDNFFSIPIFGKISFVSILASTALIFSIALLTTNICNRFRLTESYTNLPSLIVVLFSCLIANRLEFHNWMIILTLHLFIFNKLFKASLKSHPETNFFDCTFLLGISALFYPPIVLLLPALVFSFYIIQPAKFQYLSISIVSFLMPFLFLTVYLFWQKSLFLLPLALKSYWFEVANFSLQKIQTIPILFFPFLSCGIMAIFFWVGRSYMFQVNQKNILKTCTTYIIASILVLITFQITGFQIQASMIIPASFVLSYFFFYQNEQFSNVLLLLLLIISIVYPWVSV